MLPLRFSRFAAGLSLSASLFLLSVSSAHAQDTRHGRKYKAPPETAHLEVLVIRDQNGKVVENAAIVFHPTKDGEDEGNLEIKSGPDGRAFIDLIPRGSRVGIQVIAPGYETWAGSIDLKDPSDSITVKLVRPRAQVSTYADEDGKPNDIGAGIQEPVKAAPVQQGKPLSAGDPVIKLAPSVAVPAKQAPNQDGEKAPPVGDQGPGTAPQP